MPEAGGTRCRVPALPPPAGPTSRSSCTRGCRSRSTAGNAPLPALGGGTGMPRGDLYVHPSPSPASDFMGFMAEYLTHHVQLDLEALCHGHPQLRHLSTALATACRALHRSVAWGQWGWSGDTPRGHPPCPRPLSVAECRVQARKRPHRLSPALSSPAVRSTSRWRVWRPWPGCSTPLRPLAARPGSR